MLSFSKVSAWHIGRHTAPNYPPLQAFRFLLLSSAKSIITCFPLSENLLTSSLQFFLPHILPNEFISFICLTMHLGREWRLVCVFSLPCLTEEHAFFLY